MSNTLRNKRPFLIAIGVAVTATCLLAWFFLIPRAAIINLPYRWGRIPLGEKREMVHRMLGFPANRGVTWDNGEEWLAPRTNGDYTLTIRYNADTIAASYQIHFHYQLGFLQKTYTLKEESKP